MTQVATLDPVRRPVRRAPASDRRPRLEVVRAPARGARLVLVLGVALTVGALFTLVAVNVLIAQGQFELDRLSAELDAEQLRYEELRLDVAELVSPEHVVTAARELGLVPPAVVEYVEAPDAAPAVDGSDETTSTLAQTWSDGKASLARGR